jgi:hypothetical protein
MSTTTAPGRSVPVGLSASTNLRALAVAESRRFARHPLFLLGAMTTIGFTVLQPVSTGHLNADVLSSTLLPSFFLGVFGFVVAHRLTTSLRRSDEVVGTAPVQQQRRTVALCLACLVPASVGLLWMVGLLVIGELWPPVGVPVGAPVAWFGDESAVDIVSVLLAGGPVAALGGSLLGVAVARWAPFRGSALLGMVALIAVATMANNAPTSSAFSPFVLFPDEVVRHEKIVSSSLHDEVTPAWYLLYALCLCGLAVVAALLRDTTDRRRLLMVGTVLSVVGLGSVALSLS